MDPVRNREHCWAPKPKKWVKQKNRLSHLLSAINFPPPETVSHFVPMRHSIITFESAPGSLTALILASISYSLRTTALPWKDCLWPFSFRPLLRIWAWCKRSFHSLPQILSRQSCGHRILPFYPPVPGFSIKDANCKQAMTFRFWELLESLWFFLYIILITECSGFVQKYFNFYNIFLNM